tara:strand:- start:812 stop:2308 length:1497 start_codon:yes stop_codon:yes gene_type:complete
MDTKNNNLDDYIDWSGYGVDALSAKEVKENLIKPKESVVEFDDSIDWDIYDEPSVVETLSSKAPPIHPIQSLDDAVKIIMSNIKKVKGSRRGKGWYQKKKTDKKTGKVYKQWKFRKQFTHEGKKYRIDCDSHAEFKQRKEQIIKEADLLTDDNSQDKQATYSEAFKYYLNAEDIELKTKKRRTSFFKTWIEPRLGKEIVYTTTNKQIETFFESIKEEANNKPGLKNPPQAVYEAYKVLNAFFNFSINELNRRYILKNPISPYVKKWVNKNVTKYKATKINDKNSINESEVRMLMGYVIGKIYEIVYHWMAFHGMRGSEALAIHWDDIDFENNRVHVFQQTARNSEGKIYIKKRTKNLKKRYVPLDNATRELLLQTPMNEREGLVFVRPDGSIDTQDAFHKRVHLPILKELGLIENERESSPNDSYLRKQHALRKFFSSWKTQNGESVTDVSAWIGDKISTTQDYYMKQIESENNKLKTNSSFSSFYEESEKTHLRLVV